MAATRADLAGHRARLPWWSEAWRFGVVLFLGLMDFVLTLVDMATGTPAMTAHQGGLLVLDLVVGLLAVAALPWRRAHPVAVVVGVGLASAVSSIAGAAWLLAATSASTRRRPADLPAIVLPSLVGVVVLDRLQAAPRTPDDAPWQWLVVFTLVLDAAVVAVGWYIGARRDLVASLRERAATVEREETMRLARARTNERAAIAREMHDVLAHRISLIAMHAGALTYRQDLTREQMTLAAGTIEENAHQALTDLRDVLGVLRDPEANGTIERPQPTLTDVAVLVEEFRAAGGRLRVVSSVTDEPPATMGRHAFRIVQEALTNARKHAPRGEVDLEIAGAPGGRLVVTVSNPLPEGAPRVRLPGSGSGLAGMGERADLAGGELVHGPTPDGRFTVRATLPWPADQRKETA